MTTIKVVKVQSIFYSSKKGNQIVYGAASQTIKISFFSFNNENEIMLWISVKYCRKLRLLNVNYFYQMKFGCFSWKFYNKGACTAKTFAILLSVLNFKL